MGKNRRKIDWGKEWELVVLCFADYFTFESFEAIH